MNKPTRTTNRLHFSDLDPMRFEDLCFSIVYKLNNWKEINHIGRKGADGGVDIEAVQEDPDRRWYIQCKRYTTITKSEIKGIIDKIITNPVLPDKLLVIVACDVDRKLIQFLKEYSVENGIQESEIWMASKLEAKLYHDYKDLLWVYFGVRLDSKTVNNAAKIKQSLRMEKRVAKELLDHKFINSTVDHLLFHYNPEAKFISAKIYIRSIDDTSYPDCEETPLGQISSWFTSYFYDLYHNGLEIWVGSSMVVDVIMDKDGNWEPLEYDESKKECDPNFTRYKAKAIGRLPYFNIVDLKIDGDEYSSEPHLFCKFSFDGSPFEEVYYKVYGDPERKIADWELDKSKRTIFTH